MVSTKSGKEMFGTEINKKNTIIVYLYPILKCKQIT